MENKGKTTRRLFSVIVALMPLLNEYSIKGVPGSLADIGCLIMVVLIFARRSIRTIGLTKGFFVCLCLLLANNMLYLLLDHDALGDERLYLRLYIYIFVILFGFIEMGDLVYGIKTLRVVAIGTSIYCWIQFIAIKILHVYLPSYLPFFQYREDLDAENAYMEYTYFYRPHSIFSEPSIFCEYILIYFAILLSYKEFHKIIGNQKSELVRFIEVIFFTATLFITGSTTGTVGNLIFWGLYVVNMVKKRRFMFRRRYMILLPMVVTSAYYIFHYYVFQTSTYKIFVQRTFIDRSALIGRFGNVCKIFDVNVWQFVAGRGFAFNRVVDEVGWIPGFALVFAYFGLIGVLSILLILLSLWFKIGKENLFGKFMFFNFIVMNLTSYPFFSSFLITDLFYFFLSIKETETAEGPAIARNVA